ncbi:MAG: VOC family protein [Novosphingobium sp.]|nr:VOC family protein [Novosphingobium sp.]
MFQGKVFQNGYICKDIHAAVAEFANQADVRIIGPFDAEVTLQASGRQARQVTKLAFVWQGGFQYELIEPIVDETGVYGNFADNGGTMHFHHLAMRVDDWDAFRAAVDAQDLPVVLERATAGDALKFLYLDARSVCGHYLEYVWMSDERWAQIGGPAA